MGLPHGAMTVLLTISGSQPGGGAGQSLIASGTTPVLTGPLRHPLSSHSMLFIGSSFPRLHRFMGHPATRRPSTGTSVNLFQSLVGPAGGPLQDVFYSAGVSGLACISLA